MSVTWGHVFMQPFFPLGNVIEACQRPVSAPRTKPERPGYIGPWDVKTNLLYILGLTNRILLAGLFMSSPVLWPVAQAGSWGWWIVVVCARDVVLSLIVCGAWDWFLYFSPLSPRLRGLKLNPNIPPLSQFAHDAFHTSLASICGGLLECVVLHLLATGKYVYRPVHWPSAQAVIDGDFSTLCHPSFLVVVAVILFTTHWRLPHFYLIHRASHKWGWSLPLIGDVGNFLYQKVHKLHHRSRNPTSFSGISMHPIEATLYFSAALIPLFFRLHPITFLVCKLDLSLGAQIGHDGFQYPGGASYVHWLHHHYFECNYSENVILSPDHLFGTFYDGSTPWEEYSKQRKMGNPKQPDLGTNTFTRSDDVEVEARAKGA